MLDKISTRMKQLILFGYDLLVVCMTLSLALSLFTPFSLWQNYLWLFPLFLAARLPCYYVFDLYKFMWRYASTKEYVNIVKAASISSLIIVTLLFMTQAFSLPKGIFLVEWAFNVIAIGFLRVVLKMFRAYIHSKASQTDKTKKNILIIGAGSCGVTIAREIVANRTLEYNLKGFVDDHPNKIGQRILQVPVLGRCEDIPNLAKTHHIQEAIIAIPSAPGTEIRKLMTLCEMAKISFQITPGLSDIIGGKVSINQLRDVKLEDLLRRPVVQLDTQAISSYLKDKIVLITGAGGSIGSEIARQVHHYSPKQLMLLDHSENAVYRIHTELSNRQPFQCLLTPAIIDIKNRDRVDKLMNHFRPDVVFHAAAFKHVPLMETHAQEVIENNVIGTKHVLDLSEQYKVKDFVLISTDKAVNPANCMGASKRLCEIMLQSASQNSETKFSAVRFGNVLGSNGSVVPLFKSQIAQGGPITVTHPEMTRFFMTIPEAVKLVTQTAALSLGGEIFILDMGNPVKIIDLAHDLIHLSGLEKQKDISIQITGPRPGEKITEELFFDKKSLKKTSHKKIFVTEPLFFDKELVTHKINLLLHSCKQDTEEETRLKLLETAQFFSNAHTSPSHQSA